MRHPKLFSFIAALGLGACVSAFAQTTSPLPGPFPADPTPNPERPHRLPDLEHNSTTNVMQPLRLRIGDVCFMFL